MGRYSRRVLLRIALVAAGLSLVYSRTAEACSCESSPEDRELHSTLRRAREEAGAIYLARVVGLSPDEADARTATVQVLEVFKGTVKPSETLSVPTGRGRCWFPFELGKTYLTYSGDLPTSVSFCSRTRAIQAEWDVELAWLQGGPLPPNPTALTRETVSCTPCSLATVVEELLGEVEASRVVRRTDALAVVAERRPFWAAARFDLRRKHEGRAVGLSRELRAFELIQVPYEAARESCRQRVVRRWCKALEPLEEVQPSRSVPLRCIDPGPEEEVCNEEKTRKATWGPLEPTEVADCDWRDPSQPWCELQTSRGTREIPSARQVLFRCSPAYDARSLHRCVVTTPGAP